MCAFGLFIGKRGCCPLWEEEYRKILSGIRIKAGTV